MDSIEIWIWPKELHEMQRAKPARDPIIHACRISILKYRYTDGLYIMQSPAMARPGHQTELMVFVAKAS